MTTPQGPPVLSAAKRAVLERRLRYTAAPARIPRRPDGSAPPLSFAQERVWFMEQYAPGTAAYATPIAVRLRGPLDRPALQAALDALAARHETLRMTFPAGADGRPEVRVADAGHLPLELVEAHPGDVYERLRALAGRPFDLASGPLMRALLATLPTLAGAEQHMLVLAGHHIIGDGWSSDILLKELMQRYHGAVTGTLADLPALPVRYGDFARWQREQLAGPGFARHREYWTGQLAALPALDLPTDRPRPPTQRFAGATHRFTLDPTLSGALVRLGQEHGATLFMTLLAAYQTLLARHSGQDDFAVGSPVAGRPRPEVEGLVGMFVNMLALRAGLSGDPGFTTLLARTRKTVLDALTYQDLPFEHVVNDLGVTRDASRSSLFQVTFAMHNFAIHDRTVPLGGDAELAADWRPLELPATRFDLELQVAAAGSGLACAFTYDTALFDPATVARLAERFAVLLGSIVAAPDRPVSRLALLSGAERRRLTVDWNDTAAEVPAAATLPALVQTQAARTPSAVAVTGADGELSYVELNRRANRVAHRLRAGGAGPETLVAVCAERSLDLVVGLLGVLKAGAAYVPLDPDHPPGRLAYLVADAGAPILLTQGRLADRLAATAAGTEVLLLDEPGTWAGQPDADPRPLATAANPAYVIYTSGSTGRPKGVPNTHGAVCDRLAWMQRTYGLSTQDVVLQKTPAGFDVSVWEFFWPLTVGARLVLARPGGHKDPAYLRDLIVSAGVTIAHFVPSMLAMFVAEDAVESCRTLRRVLCGGEELPRQLADRLLDRLPGCELYNQYGPTEAAIDVSSGRYRPGDPGSGATVPIGRPIQNVRLYVLDRWREPVPTGVAGELFIGGAGVARGYWRRPALTAERFVPDPFGPPGSRLYDTGDRVRWTAGGVLEFLGRNDSQVKLRGLRIELGEIESHLRDLPAVRDAVVVVRDDPPAGRRLVAYVVPATGGSPDVGALRSALKSTLPDYMVPAVFVELAALPVTANGKLDRAALPAPARDGGEQRGYAAPRGPGEDLVAGIWAEVLGLDRVGRQDDFFDLGGHSMLATQVVARLRTALQGTGRSVGVMDVFTHRTVAELATLVDGPAPDGPRRLLYELTRPVPGAERVGSLVCLPYGGGSAAVYQPLADALPPGYSLYSLAIPGHDVGLDEAALPFDELARRTTEEVLGTVDGPLVLYGHCGVGGALVTEVARRLENAGRELQAVYVGAIFPFASTNGPMSRLLAWLERRTSDRHFATWLKARGVDMDELDPDQAQRIIRNMRADSRQAEAYFTDLLDRRVEPLRAPIISVIGERDPATDYYEERFREWNFLTGTSAVVVLDEAGHYFLKYRAEELAAIVTGTHGCLAGDATERLSEPGRPGASWWLHGVHRASPEPAPAVQPSMRRFIAVAAGQLVSMAGSALTAWAIPVYIYVQTGSLARFSLLAVSGLIPSLLVAPLAGAVVDRADRRRVMIVSGVAAGAFELALGVLYRTGHLQPWHLYATVAGVASALAFQRLAFSSAIPQLVPKRFLGNANGAAQLSSGFAMLLVPLVAAGLLATIGLGNILLLDVASYGLAIGVLALVRFPDLMGRRRREPLLTEIAGGFRYSWGSPALRAVLLFSAVVNVFLGPALILVAPLVLSIGSLGQLGRVSFAEACGAFTGGLLFTVWGGPARRRMRGMLLMTFVLAGCCLVTGLRPAVPLVAAGVFGTGLSLAVIQAIYTTIVQVKVPQRFHGRVFALNQMLAWSTLPLAFGVLAPLATAAFQPLLAPHGALAGTVGRVIGVGPGRGIGLVYLVVALAVATLALVGLRRTVLSRFDRGVPDAIPDDLVGVQALRDRADEAGRTAPGATLTR